MVVVVVVVVTGLVVVGGALAVGVGFTGVVERVVVVASGATDSRVTSGATLTSGAAERVVRGFSEVVVSSTVVVGTGVA